MWAFPLINFLAPAIITHPVGRYLPGQYFKYQLVEYRENYVKKIIIAGLVALFASNAALADCAADAAQKKLAGAAKNSFMQKCEREAANAPSCAEQAAQKKLAGAAKNSFMQKCERGTAPAKAPSCAEQAAQKKLAGAAKNSFMQKCEKNAK